MMKFKKNYPKVSVLEHGGEYISPDFAPICPECGSENCRLALNFGREKRVLGGILGQFIALGSTIKSMFAVIVSAVFASMSGGKLR